MKRILTFCLPLICFVHPSLSRSEPISFLEARQTKQSEILSLSSDQDAILWFTATFGKKMGINPLQGKKSQRATLHASSSEISHEISQFMTHLIISIRAERIQTSFRSNSLNSLNPFLDRKTPQFEWLLTKDHTERLVQLMDLTEPILKLSQDLAHQEEHAPPEFAVFASYFDQKYPHLIGSSQSWVSLLENEGVAAVNRRFNHYWDERQNDTSQSENILNVPSDRPQAYVAYYMKTRLLPVFVSHLISLSIRLQAKAEHQAGEAWTRLIQWKEAEQKTRALTRLCGTWQWTVHNHQNHQDHKMSLSFSPTAQQIPGQPQPDLILMNGDTVYLKWIFPSGFQEDSLLLSNRDQRLEGTFKNSRGPHGNISGKRLSRCNP